MKNKTSGKDTRKGVPRRWQVFYIISLLRNVEAIEEAKKCYGIGNGVALLAEQLVGCLYDVFYREPYLKNLMSYIKACAGGARIPGEQ